MTSLTAAPAPLQMIRALLLRYRRFLIYAMIGGLAVVIDVAVFWLLDAGLHMAPLAANAVSTSTALVYSFLVNSFVNFKVSNRLMLRFLSFTLVSACGFVLSSLMLLVLVDVMHMDSVLVKVLSLPFVLVLQFTLNSKITFAAKAQTEGAPA